MQISELVDDALAGAWVADLAIAGNHLFMATGRGLHVINFKNPRAPKLVTTFNPSAEYRKITLTGALLAALRYEREPTSSFVELFDVSDPQNLRLLTNIAPTNGYSYAIAFSGNHLCVAGGPVFLVFDVTSPANPRLAGEFTLNLPEWARPEIAVSNGYAYLLHERIISVIDLNNPRNPQRVYNFESTLNPFIPRSISISGTYLWLGGFARVIGDGWKEGGAAQVLDISAPRNPQPLADYYLPPRGGRALHLSASGKVASFSTSSGLRFLELSILIPTLRVERQNSSIQLSWERTKSPFQLQQTTSIGGAGNWKDFTITPEQAEDRRGLPRGFNSTLLRIFLLFAPAWIDSSHEF